MSVTEGRPEQSENASGTHVPGLVGPGYVHLRVHSALSLLEGALPIKKLLELAKDDAQPALAIADTNNLFGAQEFSAKAWGDRHTADHGVSAFHFLR